MRIKGHDGLMCILRRDTLNVWIRINFWWWKVHIAYYHIYQEVFSTLSINSVVWGAFFSTWPWPCSLWIILLFFRSHLGYWDIFCGVWDISIQKGLGSNPLPNNNNNNKKVNENSKQTWFHTFKHLPSTHRLIISPTE